VEKRLRTGTTCLIAAGANLPSQAGSAADTLALAFGFLARPGVSVSAVSRFYRTPAFPPGAGPDFVNAAARLECDLTPAELLAVLHEVEARLGRRRNQRWEARVVDLDLIACDDVVLPDSETQKAWMALDVASQQAQAPEALVLPHPRLQDRGFVLVPLCEVAPDWSHPVTGLTVRQMTDRLPVAERRETVPLAEVVALSGRKC